MKTETLWYVGVTGHLILTNTKEFGDRFVVNNMGFVEKDDAVYAVHCVNNFEALREAAQRAFNLIKESGFKSGLTEEEFDGTLFDLEQALIRV